MSEKLKIRAILDAEQTVARILRQIGPSEAVTIRVEISIKPRGAFTKLLAFQRVVVLNFADA